MAKQIVTEIHISAPPDAVWTILTDLDGYKTWNPFIVDAHGEVTVGSRLAITTKASAKAFKVKPTITELDPGRMFAWRGHLGGVPGLFSGTHRHELTPTADGTRYVQSEAFTGLLVPFVGKVVAETQQAFDRMNAALKERAENRHLL